jgi:hypothetical protein
MITGARGSVCRLRLVIRTSRIGRRRGRNARGWKRGLGGFRNVSARMGGKLACLHFGAGNSYERETAGSEMDGTIG